MYNKIKLIFGVALSISGIAIIFKGSFLGGLLLLLAGILLIPSISEKIKEKFEFWKNKNIRKVGIIALSVIGFGIAGSQLGSQSSNSKDNTTNKDTNQKTLYSEYQNEVNERTLKLDAENKKVREKMLNDLKTNKIYQILVDSSAVSPEYIPIINAISNGLTYINKGGFAIDETLMQRLSKMQNSKDAENFVVSVVGIAQPQKGGLTNELIQVFENYKNKYGLYGEKSVLYDENGKQVGNIDYNFDFSSIFGVLDSKNHKVLDAIYEAKQKGLSVWNEPDEFVYQHIATKKGYNDFLKTNYTESKYLLNADYEMTAKELFSEYDANEVAADEKYKNKTIAVTGTIDDIGKDILDDPYLSLGVGYLESVNCYFSDENKSIISQVNKGEEIKIIGVCKGKTLNISVSLHDCKIFE